MMHTLWHNFRLWNVWAGGVILIGLLLIAAQCNPEPQPTATSIGKVNPPEITDFTLILPGPVLPGARIGIQVNVKSNGHKIDKYWWVVRAGEGSIVSGQGMPLITYEAPKTPGSYEVCVKLEYEGGPPISDSTIVEVVPALTLAIDTPAPTSTGTLVSTNTPAPTPTATLTPKPDAMVTAEALNLRVGPGMGYEIIRTLKGGETLTLLGRTSNGHWLHVTTSELEEGWVSASFVDSDRNLDGVPTVTATPTRTLLDAPTPLSPLTEDGARFVSQVELQWRWTQPLAESEYFSVRVSRQDTGEVCFHDKTQNTVYLGQLLSCNSGTLFWETVAVRLLSKDPERWLELSPSSEPQLFDFVKEKPVPPTATPDGDNGGNDDDGDGGPICPPPC